MATGADVIITNEPATGEWGAKVDTGASSIERTMAASWYGRGRWGLRTIGVAGAGNSAYFPKANVAVGMAHADTFWLGFLFRLISLPAAGNCQISDINNLSRVILNNDGRLGLTWTDDSGGSFGYTASPVLTDTDWHYIEVKIEVDNTAGITTLYLDGVPIKASSITGEANATACAGNYAIYIGLLGTPQTVQFDHDEVYTSVVAQPTLYVPTRSIIVPGARCRARQRTRANPTISI